MAGWTLPCAADKVLVPGKAMPVLLPLGRRTRHLGAQRRPLVVLTRKQVVVFAHARCHIAAIADKRRCWRRWLLLRLVLFAPECLEIREGISRLYMLAALGGPSSLRRGMLQHRIQVRLRRRGLALALGILVHNRVTAHHSMPVTQLAHQLQKLALLELVTRVVLHGMQEMLSGLRQFVVVHRI